MDVYREENMNPRGISWVVAAALLGAGPLVSSSAPRPPAVIVGLAGPWHFDMYDAGNATPAATGQRQMRLLADSTKLLWTEIFDTRSDTGTGILGYDSAKDVYYVLGAYTHEPHPMVQIGRADGSGRTILFDAASGNLESPGVFIASELRLVDSDHFEWVAADGRWRVRFTRIGAIR